MRISSGKSLPNSTNFIRVPSGRSKRRFSPTLDASTSALYMVDENTPAGVCACCSVGRTCRGDGGCVCRDRRCHSTLTEGQFELLVETRANPLCLPSSVSAISFSHTHTTHTTLTPHTHNTHATLNTQHTTHNTPTHPPTLPAPPPPPPPPPLFLPSHTHTHTHKDSDRFGFFLLAAPASRCWRASRVLWMLRRHVDAHPYFRRRCCLFRHSSEEASSLVGQQDPKLARTKVQPALHHGAACCVRNVTQVSRLQSLSTAVARARRSRKRRPLARSPFNPRQVQEHR